MSLSNISNDNTWLVAVGVFFVLMFGSLDHADASNDQDFSQLGQMESIRPIGSLRVSFFSGIPDLVGASITLSALRPIELEVGWSTLGLAWTAYGRGGAAFTLAEQRDDDGYGGSLVGMVMVGYRYLSPGVFGSNSESHGFTAHLGLEGTWWFSRHFGLTAKLYGGGGTWIVRQSTSVPQFFPDLSLSVGVAF